MKKIIVFSRLQFEKFVNTLTPKQRSQVAFIQINEPSNRGKELFHGASDPIQPSDINVMNLWFDDAEENLPLLNGEELILFNEHMAREIEDFIKVNSEKDLWVIHCTAGQCRSGAIGDVLAEYFDIPYETFIRLNPQVKPNILVKNVLRRQLYRNSEIFG